MTPPTAQDLAALATLDTPTVCNALERLDPATQARGYTTVATVCGFPHMKPIVGYARTARIRSARPSELAPVDFGTEVNVFGMSVRDGDFIHADRHGAVVVPAALARQVAAAARVVAEREAKILAVARTPGCTAERLIEVFAELDAIH